MTAERRKLDLIWNVTRVCPWNCAICCVDAAHVTKRSGVVEIRSEQLVNVTTIPYLRGQGSAYDQAMAFRQAQGLELTYHQKMTVLEHLAGFDVKIDFSGGDPLAAAENLDVLRVAAERFGRDKITLTATGGGLARCNPAEIATLIGELNFTYDNVSRWGTECRPAGYADGNLKKAAQFAAIGVRTRGECPLAKHNIDDAVLTELYHNLHRAGIDTLLLMRLFSVGRGVFRASDVPSPDQYRHAIGLLRELEARLGKPRVKLQCAMKFFDRQDFTENPCDLLRESLGLMWDGTLLASPWAINAQGLPLGEEWVLGNLCSTPMHEILKSEKVRGYEERLDENFGHCKILASLSSTRAAPVERMFDGTSDPLYAPATVLAASGTT